MHADAAALIVHDLKNELGALAAQLHEIALRGHDPSLHAVDRQCQSLTTRLVQYLLVHGQDRGLQAHVQDESPAALIDQLAAFWQARCPELQLEVAPGAPAYAFYDQRLVQLALDAAMHNACRHAHARVRLQAEPVAQGLCWHIDDDGPGPAATGSLPMPAASTGLGLALCQRVAQAHGPTGWARLGPGPLGGARFTLCLP